jgi:hypothetical protein
MEPCPRLAVQRAGRFLNRAAHVEREHYQRVLLLNATVQDITAVDAGSDDAGDRSFEDAVAVSASGGARRSPCVSASGCTACETHR